MRKVGPAYWLQRIKFCETLTPGWDSYSAKPPTPEVLAAAREFLTVVIDNPLLDRINPSVVGGIGFTFRVRSGSEDRRTDVPTVYVEFRNTGSCLALYSDPREDPTAAYVEKVEMTVDGYEKAAANLTHYLDVDVGPDPSAPAAESPKADYPVPENWADKPVVWLVYRRAPDGEEVSGVYGAFAAEIEAATYRDELKADAVTNPDSRDVKGWAYIAEPFLLSEKRI